MTATAQHIPLGDWQSHGAQETFDLGRQIGTRLRGGEILLLDGPLGAGKTVFVKGLAAGLEVDAEEVTSPSFTLVNPHAGRLTLFHIDLYRLDEGVAAAHAVDLEELLSDDRAVIVIEWAERLGNYPLRTKAWRIRITGDGEAPRTISISERNFDTTKFPS
ncbi:MAG TPA: tRNA (adenosine(37)-N6)-threonylcarbamoyltransferase complex ATPase subunit type 1 TsaE [Pyrinomonadaceae bacterium]|nr:tRNA (adenosine(37)-N6)-threonylcarbamoyltransferase complex ATPase subunit type 1 TsaE [Pyrinomonadaceae bacterium]